VVHGKYIRVVDRQLVVGELVLHGQYIRSVDRELDVGDCNLLHRLYV